MLFRSGPRIVLIHALRESVAPAMAAMASGWPGATMANLLDDSLSADLAARQGVIEDSIVARFLALGRYARSTGADQSRGRVWRRIAIDGYQGESALPCSQRQQLS